MGASQKAFGNLFEELFYKTCSSVPQLAITRFPDGCKVVGGNKMIRVQTPCDWLITYGGTTALIDTKTTETDSFPYSKISEHQVNEMVRHSDLGATSGYVIWFRKSDEIFFLSSLYLSRLMKKRGSIKGIECNSNYLGKSTHFNPKIIFGIN